MKKLFLTTEALTMYLAVVYCAGILLLTFLNPSGVGAWMLTFPCIVPSYYLFNRREGSFALAVMVFFAGLFIAILLTKMFGEI